MKAPTKVLDIDLSHPLSSITGLEGYEGIYAIIRLHDTPVGHVLLPLKNGCISSNELADKISKQLGVAIVKGLLKKALSGDRSKEHLPEELFQKKQESEQVLPSITVAVCTRNRASDLALCLNALTQLHYPRLELIVVDNAPINEATKILTNQYHQVRYICEPRPGLDWARNRAIEEATGEIIAFTDDDVVVDNKWIEAIGQLFAENPEVATVTGLVVPYELETIAQVLFEEQGGFNKGYEQKWYRVPPGHKMSWKLLGAGQFGTGANMAFKKELFNKIGYFNTALDVGTLTNGGGDLEMFFRVLRHGYTLVYEPRAMVRHRHRREYHLLKKQLFNNGSLYSFFACSSKEYPELYFSFLKMGIWWFYRWNIRRLLKTYIRQQHFPRDLVLAEIKGSIKGLFQYKKARKESRLIEEKFNNYTYSSHKTVLYNPSATNHERIGVRLIELTHPLEALKDVTSYHSVQTYCCWEGVPIAKVLIENGFDVIRRGRLLEEIVNKCNLKLLDPRKEKSVDDLKARTIDIIRDQLISPSEEICEFAPFSKKQVFSSNRLSEEITVGIILCTYNRPEGLRTTLLSLSAQVIHRKMEIIVVDNCPSSGLTPPVVQEFPQVVLVNEHRQGLAYARNAGFLASSADIMIATDDDVTMPPDWVEKLITPFAHPEVMCVTGNVLPIELETFSQQFFEEYGGLGRGFNRKEVDGTWFRNFRLNAVPAWELGATANAAFRAAIFSHPEIGLMYEPLGPGMPSGVGEDSYLYYKILKAGYRIVYNPEAFVWHSHRRTISALRKQLYNYSKGHIAHHLTTLIRDKDRRSLIQIFVRLPKWHLGRLFRSIIGKSKYPLSLILLEITGNIVSPLALYRSWKRVKREGKSNRAQNVKMSEQEAA